MALWKEKPLATRTGSSTDVAFSQTMVLIMYMSFELSHTYILCILDFKISAESFVLTVHSSNDMMTSSNGNIFRVILAFCVGNSPITGEFPTQWPVTRSFDVFFDPRLNQQLSKQ